MRRTAGVPLALVAVLTAAATASAGQPAKDLVIKTLPGIVVDTKAREVRLEGVVCLQKGALELFVCSGGTREHESVITVKAKPSHVTFALALLGLEPGQPGYTTEGGAFSPPAGQAVEIVARLKPQGGQAVEVPAWKLLRLSGAENGLDRALEWVYIGRPEPQALKAADREGTVVCLSNFREAVIDVPFESTSSNANLLYEANDQIVPPPGTPVELVIRPTGQRIAPVKVEIEVVLRKGELPALDGKKMALPDLQAALNATPAVIRTAVLRAEADESFGRVMRVNEMLRDALMDVHLAVLQEAKAAPAEKAPPLVIAVTADEQVRLGEKCLSVEAFRAQVGDLLKDVEEVVVEVDAKASMKSVAEVLTAARDKGVAVSLRRADGK